MEQDVVQAAGAAPGQVVDLFVVPGCPNGEPYLPELARLVEPTGAHVRVRAGCPMTRPRPEAVAFDVVETLMSLEPLRDQFEQVGLPAAALGRWFDRMLRDAMALTLAGDHVPFAAVARGSLQVVGGADLDDTGVQQVLEAFGRFPAQPDRCIGTPSRRCDPPRSRWRWSRCTPSTATEPMPRA